MTLAVKYANVKLVDVVACVWEILSNKLEEVDYSATAIQKFDVFYFH